MPNTKVFSILLGVCLLGYNLALCAPFPDNKKSEAIDHYHVGGEGGWDLITFDAQHHRLFVSRSTHVQVIDTDSGKIIGDIPNTAGVHGIALADELGVGFTSNGKSNSVTVFDLTTLNVIDTIKISGLNPDVILYEPKSKHIFTFNGHSQNATVIDAVSHKEVDTIALSGKPELAVSDDAGNVFVNIEDTSQVVVIDGNHNKVIKTFSLGKGIEPTGLSIDKTHHRLFSVCANKKMEILDSESGKIVAEVAIGAEPDSSAFDAHLGLAFSSNSDGTLTVVQEQGDDHYTVVKNVITQKGARTMAYDQDRHRAYLVAASFGETTPVTIEHPKPKPAIIPNSFVVLGVSFAP